MRRVKMIIPALMAATISLPAMADDEYYDTARVISVAPQTERVNYPGQECHTEYVRESYSSNDRSPLGAIIGGVAGGLLGSQVGKGNGRVAGAAVGAGVGAVVGDRIGNSQATYGTRTVDRPVERCVSVDNWQTVTRGYLVTYRYNGRNYSTMMDNDPGDNIRVRVAIGPGHGYRTDRISYLEPIYIESAYPRNFGGPPGWNKGRGWDRDHGWNKHHGRHGHGHDHDDD